MLGRLEMVVDECIAAYNKLSADVFAKPRSTLRTILSCHVKARFESDKLEKANLSTNTPFNDGCDRGCKTLVFIAFPTLCHC